MELSPHQLFDGFPEPVLMLEDWLVRYYNPAALRLFPSLAENAPLPPALEPVLGGLTDQAVVLSCHEGADWRISAQTVGSGLLILFRPQPQGEARPRTDRLAMHLRQQTAGLSAALQRLGTSRELDGEKRKQYLALANQGLYRLLRLVDHMEFLDRAEHDIYRPATMDLAGLCQEVADGVDGVCRPWGYQFRYESDLTCLITEGDDVLLRRMLLGLLSNAMKAAGPKGRFGLKLTKRGKRAVLTVWDDGPGIGDMGMGVLFGSEAADMPSLDPNEGMGLGLLAVRRVSALHGGTVMVAQQPEQGLQAVVSLPIRPTADTTLRAPETRYESGAFSPLLIEFSDLLPSEIFSFEDLE